MGGIFAAISKSSENTVPLVIEGLRRLKYRGADNSGIAVLLDGRIEIFKEVGSIEAVSAKLGLENISSRIVLGHTRFATHGRPTVENAHPHTDCGRRIAVVGEGALSNYEDLRDKLLMEGHKITSRSDFEVVAHIFESLLNKEYQSSEFLKKIYSKMEGYFSFAVLEAEKQRIIAATNGPKLFYGLSDKYVLLSSSQYALHGFADQYGELSPGELIILSKDGPTIYTSEGLAKQVQSLPLQLDPILVEKGGYKHHMLREINEVPEALLRTLSSVQKRYLNLAGRLVTGADNIYIIANGTSLNAGMIASYYFSELAGISPIVTSAAEFPLYYLENVGPGTLVIAISQSGETGDVLSSLYEAKLRGATILGITNYVGSRLARLSNLYLPIAAGPELAVPATKTFTSTLQVLYLVALSSSRQKGKIEESEQKARLEAIKKLAESLAERLEFIDSEAMKAAEKISLCRSGYVVSRGLTYPLALEGALKLKEASYFHAEGVEAGEFKHGPFVLVEQGFATIFIMPVEKVSAEATYPLIEMARQTGATVVVIGPENNQKLLELLQDGVTIIRAVETERHFAPISLAVPLQLLAYRLGEKLNRPVDTPRHLVKAVTQ
jgi:glucosamine--fructose-6-phosphate aminotransferase (isomerizing)